MAQRCIVANPRDTVATAIEPLGKGENIEGVVLCDDIPAGHKFALAPHPAGSPVVKLGQSIGFALHSIAAGRHVHSHNLGFGGRQEPLPVPRLSHDQERRHATFMGYERGDGRVGTRNYIGVLTSVNCSATVARRIAAHFTAERLAPYRNVDGVVAFSHMSGCGMAKSGRGMDNLRRTLTGYATHPNFGAVLIVGLGCEVNQIDPLLASAGLEPSDRLGVLGIQDSGGAVAAIAEGISAIERMLPIVDADRRSEVSARHLTVGLQCGGSDGYSGLTANPALGCASDLVVAGGGRVVLSETPEIFGAEALLLNRAATPEIAEQLVRRLDWWENYAARDGASLDNNPSPGNLAGGITTILEKSLGAVSKSGSTALNAVIDYAEPIEGPGFTFMDTPGYDPCSATGQIAGGANMIVFTTGRGSIFGSRPAPTLKLSSNSALAKKMADDIDLDCGRLLEGATLEQLGNEIFEAILAAASGTATASERLGIGDDEFVPWIPGAVF